MMNREEKLQNLLKLKKQETPGEAYFAAFVGEFHRYQRSEVLESRKSWLFRWKRGLSEILEDLLITPARLAQGSAAAFGVLLLAAVIFMGQNETGLDASSQGLAAAPTGVYVDGSEFFSNSATDQAELTMAHLTSFENDFEGSTYVTGEATLSYDSVIAF
jgi:hypothetical protein